MKEYIRAFRPKLKMTTNGYCNVGGICDLRVGRGVTMTIGEDGGERVLLLRVLFAGAAVFAGGESVTTGAPSVALASLATLAVFE
jgi:hypothetical protein